MKIVGLEEHVVLPPILEAWSRIPEIPKMPELGFGEEPRAKMLRDTGDLRIAVMDKQGIDVQVLSGNSPGVNVLPASDALSVAKDANDALAGVVAARRDRFQAFATVPTQVPDKAAEEFERAVTKLGFKGAMLFGRSGDTLPDARVYDDLYATAARLGAPLHFHPSFPPAEIRKLYYSGIEPKLDFAFSAFGLGWYYDLGVQILRMILTGVFDRHPELQIIIGHWGEVVLFYLDHIGELNQYAKLQRPIAEYFKQNIWIAGSGTTSERYFRWTAEMVGTDRMLYSTDYPFTFETGYPFIDTGHGRGRSFLEESPFSESEKNAIASGNWEKLTSRLNVYESAR